MEFSRFTEALERIRQSTGRIEITKQLAVLFVSATSCDIRIIIYMLLGELRPVYKGPTVFGLAERLLGPIVGDLLHMNLAEVEQAVGRHADLGELLARGTWAAQGALTVTEVYHLLAEIEAISGDKSQELRAHKVKQLCYMLRPIDAALVIRIVLGKLRLGFSDMTIIDALSWMIAGDKSHRSLIENAYNVHADLGLIAQQIKESGLNLLVDPLPVIGIPIRPAAAERIPSAVDIIARIGPCVIEPKIDGFRLQVHVVHKPHEQISEVFFFSRNLQKMDGMFPEIEAAMKLCPWNSIVEGEAVAYDEETESYFSFQETVKRKRKYDVASAAEDYPLRLMLFDALVISGVSCLHEPHYIRFALLTEMVQQLPQKAQAIISVVEEISVATAQEIDDYFNQQVASGFEGIMAKRDAAPYQAGKRNFTWIKLKNQTIGHLEDTIDTVVLGYYAGRGKRAKFGIGAFLVGVYDAQQDLFVTVAKIGTGLSDAEWIALKTMCDRYAVDTKPRNIICAQVLEPYVWIEPHIVVEVAADEITRSPVHSAAKTEDSRYGLALRFPRMISMRTDKSAADATTVKELKTLYADQQRSA